MIVEQTKQGPGQAGAQGRREPRAGGEPAGSLRGWALGLLPAQGPPQHQGSLPPEEKEGTATTALCSFINHSSTVASGKMGTELGVEK